MLQVPGVLFQRSREVNRFYIITFTYNILLLSSSHFRNKVPLLRLLLFYRLLMLYYQCFGRSVFCAVWRPNADCDEFPSSTLNPSKRYKNCTLLNQIMHFEILTSNVIYTITIGWCSCALVVCSCPVALANVPSWPVV